VIPVVVDHAQLPQHPDAVLVDVRWYLDGRNGRAAYEAEHLPGAVWVDLDRELAAHDGAPTEGRHPLPAPAVFAAAMTRIGVGDHTPVIAYDDTGGVTAGRLVVMLRMLGHDAALLDGGLRASPAAPATGWVEPTPAATPFTPRPWPADRLADADETARIAASDGAAGIVIDARAAERFSGELAMIDPRPGHVPGARSAPWASVLGDDGRLPSVDRLRAHYGSLGITDAEAGNAAVAYCGSGVSACVNIVAMEHAGLGTPRLYVASWSGWSADPDRPAALGT